MPRAQQRGSAVVFECPGCECLHRVSVVKEPGMPGWTWNGNLELPTFRPSIDCNRGLPSHCHSQVTDGRIEFFGDCTHALAGQTVDLPEMEA